MSTTVTSTRTVAIERIHIPENVRDLDEAHVTALAGSMKLLGMLEPVLVCRRGDDFDLVAGFHRMAAASAAELVEVPIHERDGLTKKADRAVENIARKQLNPYEEANAVRAMLDDGLSESGAAQALGWTKALVTARMKLLELPERAQQLTGEGVIPLAAVDQLRAVGVVAPKLLDAVVAYLDDGNVAAAQQLTRDPGWVVGSALKHAGDRKIFGAYLTTVSANEIADLRLGRKTDGLYADAEKLHKQLDRHAYGPPAVRFTDEDLDQARAAGVLIEFDNSRPIIVDRALYRELVKNAITRVHAGLEQKVAEHAAERAASKTTNKPADPATIAKRERDARLRDYSDQAHGVNTDLGHSLLNTLASVDPTDMDVARFFVYALLGADHDSSPYIQSGERIARIAAGGVRLLIEELRTDATKTRRDGSPGRLRYDYGDHRDPQAAIAWLWKYIGGAKTAAELYGRALVVIAAEQHANRLVLNGSQRGTPTTWTSHKDTAAKALRRLCRPVIPGSMTQLERAVERAHAEYDQAMTRERERSAGAQ